MDTVTAACTVELAIGIVCTFIALIGSIISLTVKGTKLLSRLEGRIEILEGKMEANCIEIKDLQAKDTTMSLQLTDINVTLKKVDAMTTKMFNHFFEEGIKSGRRTEDNRS